MKIKFMEYEELTGEKKDGELWKAYAIHGSKLENGEEWKSTNIFDNKHNASVIQKLKALQAGDKINITHVKNGRFYNVTDITSCADEPDPTTKAAGTQSRGRSAGGTSKGDTMSKAEWAEKNKVDRLSIAKSVALKAAVEAGKTTATAIIKLADELVPWLVDVELNQYSNVADEEGSDPLDPPA